MFRALGETMYEVYEFDPMVLINVFQMQASEGLRDLSPEMTERINELSAEALRLIARMFQRGVEEGAFRDHNPVALADIVWSTFAGLVLWEESKHHFHPEKRFLKPTLLLAMDILARGVARG